MVTPMLQTDARPVAPKTSAVPAARLAKNYRLINDIVRRQTPGTHLSVADVYARAKKRRPGIGCTTVYRALSRLRDLGLVSEIRLPGAEGAYYEAAGEAHAHFRCDLCGSVKDIPYVPSKRIVTQLAHRHRIEVRDVLVSLHGRCASCRERESA